MVQKESIKNRVYFIVIPIDIEDYAEIEKLPEVPGLHSCWQITTLLQHFDKSFREKKNLMWSSAWYKAVNIPISHTDLTSTVGLSGFFLTTLPTPLT